MVTRVRQPRPSLLMLASASLLALSVGLGGCGGGGGGSSAASTISLSGTAATGAPFGGAVLTVIDADGNTYGGTGSDTTGTDGSYRISIPATAKAPFVIKVTRDQETLVSIVAEAKTSTANVTPITNLIASRLSTSGDPTKLADEIKANPGLVSPTNLEAKKQEIITLLQPLLTALNVTADPLTGTLVTDGTGADRVLDSLNISIIPSASGTNIEVAVKQTMADGAAPVVQQFTNTAPLTSVTLPAVNANDLVASGTSALIKGFLDQMTACFALDKTARVGASGTTAADVVAPECKAIFLANDPTAYKHNGAVVGNNKAFSPLFSTSSQGASFDRGAYDFTRNNGDLVISYRSTSTTGNAQYNTVVVRNESGKLKAIGNQYAYPGGVNAVHQLSSFIGQGPANYYSTGYLLGVSNVTDNSGNPIFDRVVVTTPKNNTLTLKPSTGSSFLVIHNGSSLTNTNVVRLSADWVDPTSANTVFPSNPPFEPRQKEIASVFFASPELTDTELEAIPAQSNWKFDYYLASAPSTLAATQHYRTRARAMTLAELRAKPMAALTSATRDALNNAATGVSNGRYMPTPASGGVSLSWTVPAAAVPPYQLSVFGRFPTNSNPNPGVSFNDSETVRSTATSGTVSCSLATNTDPHCSGSNFASGGKINTVQLRGVDELGREMIHGYAIFNLP